jgi:putative ABC transport system permease protein
MILADRLRLAMFGIVPSVVGAYAAARAMSALLFGVAPGDPATFATAVAIASFTVFAGTVVPAWRAVRMTPMSVLGAE